MHRTRPIDTLQNFMSSFKQFEKKLDKLQDDVSYHGNTLSDLRLMVTNLSVAMDADQKYDDYKRPIKRTTAIQYDERYLEQPVRMRRKNAIMPLPSKMKAKSLQDQKYGLKMSLETPVRIQKTSSGLVQKRRVGRKADVPRKIPMRKQKAIGKGKTHK